ncbi:hypothetical protein [Teredinibacter haidensis]|uniref:hypothetical protein n=1 Tax=Teredinibacter haidensis TaxID=2731755 RepID=UPI00094905DB|nr:hypothetical protein [Teredinibacter haidensis]
MKHYYIWLAAWLMSYSSMAMPAPLNQQLKAYTQPSGEKVYLTRVGNKELNWFETRKGSIVVLNPTSGAYEYATLIEVNGTKKLSASQIAVGKKINNSDFKIMNRKDLPPIIKLKLKTKKTSQQ